MTRNLAERLRLHNDGMVQTTRRLRPWQIELAVAFADHDKATAFEIYLKSHSGRAFATRHF